jgi:hypothetical protein
LVVLNAIAFGLALWLTRAIAREVSTSGSFAAATALGFGAATYSWTYAVGMWPHMTALASVAASVYFALRAGSAACGRRDFSLAFAAGLSLGVGMLFRLDAVLGLPGLLVLCLACSGREIRLAGATLLGLAPALLSLALVNLAKFGDFSPLSYGTSAGYMDPWRYAPIIFGALAIGSVGIAVSRAHVRAMVATHPRWTIAIAVVVAILALFLPWTGDVIRRLAIGLYRLLIDLRAYDPSLLGLREYRTESGALFYARSMKKTLLQSCPYFVLCIVPAALAVRQPIAHVRVLAIAIVAAGFIVPFAYFSWHGGRSLNMRYFLPALPFLVLLSFLGFRTVVAEFARKACTLAISGAITGLLVALAAIVVAATAPLPLHERLIGEAPLALAGALAAMAAISCLAPVPWRSTGRLALSATFGAALAWSAVVGLLYDGLRDQLMRVTNERIGLEAAQRFAPNSLLVTIYPDPFFVLHSKRIRLASPEDDAPEAVRRLIDVNLDAGRKVYVVVTEESLEKLRSDGVLDGIRLTVIPSDVPVVFREASRS